MGRTKRVQRLAKVSPRRLHSALPRERLFALLDRERPRRKIIWIAGPPGAGKTTLVASWLEARSVRCIWYQVDSGDADVATFFYYLREGAAGLRTRTPLPLLTAEYLHDVFGFSRRFFRELFSRLPNGSVLVLDNYQEVSLDNRLHALIAQAADEVGYVGH